MKRRKKIIIISGCIVMVIIFFVSYMNEATTEIKKEWFLTDEEMSSIQIIGLSQNLDISIELVEGNKNQVILEGGLPVSYANKVKDIVPEKKGLLIDFKNDWGFSVAKNTKNVINITIYITKEDLLEKLIIKSNRGDVNIKVPENFEKKYQLLTNSGVVIAPEEQYDVTQIVKVELGFGNIKVFNE